MSTLVDDILHSLNGRVTGLSSVGSLVKNKAAHAIRQERDGNYAMGLNTNGNVNPWYKNDWNAVRAVAALGEEERVGWVEAFMDCTRKKRTTNLLPKVHRRRSSRTCRNQPSISKPSLMILRQRLRLMLRLQRRAFQLSLAWNHKL